MKKLGIKGIIILAVILWIGFGVIGGLLEEHRDYPGKRAFREENSKLDVYHGVVAFGNSTNSVELARSVSMNLKEMQKLAFSGGSQFHPLTEDHFLTYCQQKSKGIVFLCHVPGLRHYKGKTRDSLARLAWLVVKNTVESKGIAPSTALVVGLRGIGSYGPVWEGTVGGEPTQKGDGVNEERRLYSYFLDP